MLEVAVDLIKIDVAEDVRQNQLSPLIKFAVSAHHLAEMILDLFKLLFEAFVVKQHPHRFFVIPGWVGNTDLEMGEVNSIHRRLDELVITHRKSAILKRN